MYIRFVIWQFLRFLWNRSSLNAFSVVIWIDRYLSPKDKISTAECLRRSGEDEIEREKKNGNGS